MSTVYLEGAFVPKAEARVSVDDRGFLLGDGVYEVIPFYEGVPVGMDRHMARLRRSLEGIRIGFDPTGLDETLRELVSVNGLDGAERSLVYAQITRGSAPRMHYFPAGGVQPTVYAYAAAWNRPADEVWERGFTAVTAPDRRWMRVDLKTICLLPNGLAWQDAREAGVDDAILVRDGVASGGPAGRHRMSWAARLAVLLLAACADSSDLPTVDDTDPAMQGAVLTYGTEEPSVFTATGANVEDDGDGEGENVAAELPGPPPLVIHGKTSEWQLKDGVVVFEGDVTAVRDTVTLTCDRLEVTYEGERVRDAVATGNVRVVRGERVARGKTATLTADDGRVVLEGDPRVEDGPNTMVGERIVLFLDDERLECARCRLEVKGEAIAPRSPP